MQHLEFLNKKIGHDQPTFIIAEAGVNHNGDLGLAKKLVEAAFYAGADAIKFQTWDTNRLITKQTHLAEYQAKNTAEYGSQFEMLKALELKHDEFRELQSYANSVGILFFSTPDEEYSADFLDSIEVPIFKIGSAELTNIPFLLHISAKLKPIILSTGMATLGEVERAVNQIQELNDQLCILHCVSQYPAAPRDCNLLAMDTLKSAFQLPVGFSDHTLGHEVAIAAVAKGACVIEKHMTLDTDLPGPDHSASLDPKSFREMVTAIRNVEEAIGNGRKEPKISELSTKEVVRKKIVAIKKIRKGHQVAESDLALKRAAQGWESQYIQFMVGRTAKEDIEIDQVIDLHLLL